MNSLQISKNLEELLIFLLQEQINDESSKLIQEIINIQKNEIKHITKSFIIKKFTKKNLSEIYIEKIIEKLNNLDLIEIEEEIKFKINNILNILLYPRYCYFVNNIYGPKCLKIFEYLLEYGFYIHDGNKEKNNFNKIDLNLLVKDDIIAINKNKNNEIKYRINYNNMNKIMFKEYIINYYRKYISMNFKFYELFKKVVNSDNYIYELNNNEKNILSQAIIDNFDYSKLLLKNDKEDNKIILNFEIIKYDLFYNSIEKIINLFFSSKHVLIFKIIQFNEYLTAFQISQKACLKSLEVQEIIDDLIKKLNIVKKIKKEEHELYLLNEMGEININILKDNIYGIIKNIKYELKDKLKELQGRIDKDMVIQYINKYYSLINTFSEILNSYNFILV